MSKKCIKLYIGNYKYEAWHVEKIRCKNLTNIIVKIFYIRIYEAQVLYFLVKVYEENYCKMLFKDTANNMRKKKPN